MEKVGRLTKALRFSEKDKRTVTDELRVRRKDLKDAKDEVAAYDGLDAVSGYGLCHDSGDRAYVW